MRHCLRIPVVTLAGMALLCPGLHLPGEAADEKTPSTSPSIHDVLGNAEQGKDSSSAAVPAIDSRDATTHLTFATILFYRGLRLMRTGEPEAARVVFFAIEKELLMASRLADTDQDDRRRGLVKSQCAYLLGDLAAFVLVDKDKAKAFYQEALTYFPEHDGAREALKHLESTKPSPKGP